MLGMAVVGMGESLGLAVGGFLVPGRTFNVGAEVGVVSMVAMRFESAVTLFTKEGETPFAIA